MEDLKWIVQTTTLFDDMFGPDNFTFWTVNKSVVVHEDSRPKLAYDHSTWEENYDKYSISMDSDDELPPKWIKQVHLTTTGNKPKAQCSLNDSYTSTGIENNGRKDLLPVPRWGGTASLDGNIQVKLLNTCPIDNYLTIFYLYFNLYPDMYNQLALSSAQFAQYLTETVSQFRKGEFALGKVHWLQQFFQSHPL